MMLLRCILCMLGSLIFHFPSVAQTIQADASDITQPSRPADIVKDIVNRERSRYRRHPLRLDARLSRVAQAFARDMVRRGYFSHTSPEGRDMSDRFREGRVFYSTAGENIARGAKDGKDVMSMWMESSGHRRNILNSDFNRIGVGNYQNHWVQVFTD